MYLYHATSIKNKQSIDKHGLLIGCKSNWQDIYTSEAIYLAVDPDVAEDYVTASDTYNGEEVIVYQVDINDIDQSKVYYDWNNRCEYSSEINSVEYRDNIPPKFLSPAKERDQEIEDFKGTLLYERVMRVFDEEVETNLEKE